jgi:hypothetical protein
MKDSERCDFLDEDGCRCETRRGHAGIHSPTYTPWSRVLDARARRRLEAIRDGAIAAKGPRGDA